MAIRPPHMERIRPDHDHIVHGLGKRYREIPPASQAAGSSVPRPCHDGIGCPEIRTHIS